MANKVTLTGTLGNVPDAKTLGDDLFVGNFSLYTKETWRDKKTGQKVNRTVRHNCEVWNKLALNLSKNMTKGKKYYVEGSLEYDEFKKDGQDHRLAKVKVQYVEFL